MRYLVKTAGRTGSHLITAHLSSMLNMPYRSVTVDQMPIESMDHTKITHAVMHDHTRNIPQHTTAWCLVVGLRRNICSQALSACIAAHHKNFGRCAVQDTSEFEVDPKRYTGQLLNYATYAHYAVLLTQQLPWHSVHEIYYEDFIHNPNYLVQQFGGTQLDYSQGTTHPGRSHHCVSNRQHLLELGKQQLMHNHTRTAQLAREWFELFVGHTPKIDFRTPLERTQTARSASGKPEPAQRLALDPTAAKR